MQIFSFHLVETTVGKTLKALICPPKIDQVDGLRHLECMTAMTLGAPILSAGRMQLRHLAVFAAWENSEDLDAFSADTELGRTLAGGWHVRLELIRRWGEFSELDDFLPSAGEIDPEQAVVAVTLARLRVPQVFRFIRWGKPVEEQVRDHPGTSLALAAIRPPRTFSTFSVWRSLREMTEMVHGKGSSPGAGHHAQAMQERDRKDFHHQFTTLRFRVISEHGAWEGRSDIVPKGESI